MNKKDLKYFWVIQTLYDQQYQMFISHTHTIEHCIVSIHQPHVRPIVRGKSQAKVEFGARIHVSVIDGISFLDELSWDAFNEGSHMKKYVEQYRKRFGCYPIEGKFGQAKTGYGLNRIKARLQETNESWMLASCWCLT
jgi:hypothetical protein